MSAFLNSAVKASFLGLASLVVLIVSLPILAVGAGIVA